MNKINFICQVFYPDTQATSQLFTPLMEELVKSGYHVEVYCGYPNNRLLGKALPRHEVRNGVSIRRCGLNLATKKGLVSRALAYATFLADVFFQLVKAPSGRINFGVTNPPFVSWILYLIKFFRGHEYHFMFLDLHPEGLVALGKLNEHSMLVSIWMYLNRLSYRCADGLIVLGRDMGEKLSGAYQIEPSRFIYIPHWSASSSFKPISFESSSYTRKLGIQDKFVIQYSGNMGLWHDIDTFVRAAHLLMDHERIRFVFIGGGIRLEPAKKLASNLKVNNIEWHDYVPLDNLSDSLASCHIALISLNSGLEGVAVPCKLYGILSSGRMVVAQVPKYCEVDIVLNESFSGITVEPGDHQTLAQVLLMLSNDIDFVQRSSVNALNVYREKYQLKNAVQNFINYFESFQ